MISRLLIACICAIFISPFIIAQEPNPCTNGSFEEVGPNGVPTGWQPLGNEVAIVHDDVHSGANALLFKRNEKSLKIETGLNRGWAPAGGDNASLITQVKGGFTFWYKAKPSKNGYTSFQVIPMDERPFESTGSSRAEYRIPKAHEGDGKWHQGKIKYDYTAEPKVKWVHFAVRMLCEEGEVLADDFSFVEQTGPFLVVQRMLLEENRDHPGVDGVISLRVINMGDAPTADATVSLTCPPGIVPDRAFRELRGLSPGNHSDVKWAISGKRMIAGVFEAPMISEGLTEVRKLVAEPVLELRSFGSTASAVVVSNVACLEAEIKNTGDVFLLAPKAVFTCGGKTYTAMAANPIPPGGTSVLKALIPTTEETPVMEASVEVGAGDTPATASASTQFAITAPVPNVPANGEPAAGVSPEGAWVSSGATRMVFPRNVYGFGPAFAQTIVGADVRTVGAMRQLSRLVRQDAAGQRVETPIYATTEPVVECANGQASLRFAWTTQDAYGTAWNAEMTFMAKAGEPMVSAGYTLSCQAERGLLAFDGPMVWFEKRDEAVYPGLEWLQPGEVSSSTLDIQEGHPHQVRYVVHSNMITIPAIGMTSSDGVCGMMWDHQQAWDGQHDRPAAAFASPDRFNNQRGHLTGLFLPSVPDYVSANQREAATPYKMQPGKSLSLACSLVADAASRDVLAVMDRWVAAHGWPEPLPLLHGSFEGELAFSMNAYLTSMWDADKKEWWTSKDGPISMSYLTRPPLYLSDLLLGAALSPEPAMRAACEARVAEVIPLMKTAARWDIQRFSERPEQAELFEPAMSAFISSVQPDGSWRFDADYVPSTGVFKGFDYSLLGKNGDEGNGLCAKKAYSILRYARATGDWQAYEAAIPTLEYMRKFTVPTASQVWEVPVHAPDILAAADAVDAYVEAYRFSGEQRWLDEAVKWARRGLPFIYLWNAPEYPFMRGASIPVFGATMFSYSWFGLPVQWNGLDYAEALIRLAVYDQSYPWVNIADLVTRSAIYQQDADGENIALWPDNQSAMTGEKCPWVFNPRQIIDNLLRLMGRQYEYQTRMVGEGRERIHISAPAELAQPTWLDGVIEARVQFAAHQPGVVLFSNVNPPAKVLLDGVEVAESQSFMDAQGPVWRYSPSLASVAVFVPSDQPVTLRLEGAAYQFVERMPTLSKTFSFGFDSAPEGWTPACDVADISIVEGCLTGHISGIDPYIVRPNMEVDTQGVKGVKLRLKVSSGGGGQLFWTTKESPAFDETKQMHINIQGDGEFHEYVVDLSEKGEWAGRTVTGIRLDLPGGLTDATFAMDWVEPLM